MKRTCLLLIFSLTTIYAHTQINLCRPGICLIDYNYHDDSSPNADMAAIKAALPDILIDNTPGGYWGGGCLPAEYTPLGIQVFSYITGGYEGTKYGTSEDALSANIARVDQIAIDGATGVFLDEVSSHPNSSGKAYITAIYNECLLKGLKLIVNPGVSDFDSWLMSHCDYLMSNEEYNGTRAPTVSESPFADRILVVSQGINSASAAASVSEGAQTNGFGFSYACHEYVSLPSWLSNYMVLITHAPPSAAITINNNMLQSSSSSGNQWYNDAGIITGATSQSYLPNASSHYYVIVHNSYGCSSDTSNIIYFETGHTINGKTRYAGKAIPGNSTTSCASYNSTIYNIDQVIVRLVSYPGRNELSRDTSDPSVNFQFQNTPDGTYILSYKKYTLDTMQWGNGIDAIDVSLLKYYIGVDTLNDGSRCFSGKYKKAADVDNNTMINAIDISRIKAKIGAPYNATINFPKGNWMTLDTVLNVAGTDLNITLKTLCYGDYNASSSKYIDSASLWSNNKYLKQVNSIFGQRFYETIYGLFLKNEFIQENIEYNQIYYIKNEKCIFKSLNTFFIPDHY